MTDETPEAPEAPEQDTYTDAVPRTQQDLHQAAQDALQEPVTDLLGAFHAKVGLACQEVLDTKVEFAVGHTVAPTDQHGNFTSVFVLTVAIPSLEIGRMIQTVVLVPNLWIDQETVSQQVRAMVEALHGMRDSMAQQAMASSPVGANGHGPLI